MAADTTWSDLSVIACLINFSSYWMYYSSIIFVRTRRAFALTRSLSAYWISFERQLMTIKTSPAEEKALQMYGELMREGEHTLNQDGERAITEDEREVPAYTRLPALMKKSSLAARLGFANLSV